MTISLSSIVGIVTGGASGLGAAAAAKLIRSGGRVVIADLGHQYERYLALANALCEEAGRDENTLIRNEMVMTFIETDVTNEDQVKNALDAAEGLFGEPVNAAINCAGVAIAKKILSKSRESKSFLPQPSSSSSSSQPPSSSSLSSPQLPLLVPHDLSDFVRVLEVNTLGSFNVSRLAAQRMVLREADGDGVKGCIIHTASIAALEGQRGQCAYAASKAAVVGMTLPMARDLAEYGIRVMTIAPGLFLTPLVENLPEKVREELGKTVPLPSRMGHPAEFGELVGSILENNMLNGEVIRLDGAVRMPP